MYDYNASYLNEQSTLIEEFHKIQRYLIEHPLYQIYQSSADYVAGVNEYYINEVSVREGSTLGVGDVVLFSNVYYGVITEINEETEMFTIAQGISFRGATGETGPRGGVGPRGLPGADGRDGTNGTDGTDGTDGKNGLSIYLYDGVLNEDTTTINFVDQIELPTGRAVEVGDLLLSTYASSFGAIAQVVGVDSSGLPIILTVDYIGLLSVGDYDNLENKPIINADLHSGYHTPVANTYYRHIGTTLSPYARGVIYYYDGNTYTEIIGGGGGGGVSDVQINGTTIVADGVANIPYASVIKAGLISTGSQYFAGQKTFTETTKFNNNVVVETDTGGYNLDVYPSGLSNWYIHMRGGSSAKSLRIFNGNSDGIILNTGGLISRYYGTSGTSYSSTLPSYTGTLLSAPSTWSTGTSGSVTLPSAALYELKITTTFGEYDVDNVALVNFAKDGTKGAISTPLSLVSTSSISTGFIVVDPTGVMTLLDTAVGEGDTTAIIRYRKIGIA